MGCRVNTLFTSLPICKILRFLSIIAPRDNKLMVWYVTNNSITFILCLSLLFSLNLENSTFLISELIRSFGYFLLLFRNHKFISSIWFSKFFSELHNLIIWRVRLKSLSVVWMSREIVLVLMTVSLTYTSVKTLPFLKLSFISRNSIYF